MGDDRLEDICERLSSLPVHGTHRALIDDAITYMRELEAQARAAIQANTTYRLSYENWLTTVVDRVNKEAERTRASGEAKHNIVAATIIEL